MNPPPAPSDAWELPTGILCSGDARPDLTAASSRFGSVLYLPLGTLSALASPLFADHPISATGQVALLALFGAGRWLHTRPDHPMADAQWDRRFALWTLGLASAWCALVVPIFLLYGSHPGTVVSLLCTCGIASGGISSMAPRLKLLRVWLALLLAPMAAISAWTWQSTGVAIPISIVLFLVYLLRIGRQAHTKYWDLLTSEKLLRQRAEELEREVSQRADAQRSLRDSEAHLRKVLEHSPLGIYDLDPHGEALSTNEAARKLSRGLLSAEELDRLGYAPGHVIHEDDLNWVRDLFSDAVLLGKEAEFECRNRQGGWLAGAIVPIVREGEKTQHVVAILRDVTKRRQIDESLQLAVRSAQEASELKSRFLANISHEIRTPLNGVLGIAQLLHDTALDDQQKDLLTTLEASSEALQATINDLLDFSKIESGTLQIEQRPLLLAELGERSCAPFRAAVREAGLTLEVTTSPENVEVLGDHDRLRQVLINLIGNAVKFTSDGSIRVDLRAVSEEEPLEKLGEDVAALPQPVSTPGQIEIRVEDTGVGIPADRLEKIFDAFEQADGSRSRSQGGVGLGLTISRQLIEAMGGSIQVESETNRGTSFLLRLPTLILGRNNEPTSTRDDDEDTSLVGTTAPNLRPLSVLLVEDNRVNQLVASRLVERMGHSVQIAANGLEALEKVAQGCFDLILMDVQMPVMDGLEAVRRLRAREAEEGTNELPVIAVTAHAMSDDRQQCLEAGMNDYLTKPIDADQLERIVSHYQEIRIAS